MLSLLWDFARSNASRDCFGLLAQCLATTSLSKSIAQQMLLGGIDTLNKIAYFYELKYHFLMNIAIFGDLHGRVLLPFFLCACWEEEHREIIQYALCVGDAGIFRSFYHMEKTSQRWATKCPEELGFSKFFYNIDPTTNQLIQHPVADQILMQTKIDLYFVPGNHEDHQYIGRIWYQYAQASDKPFAVDRLWEEDIPENPSDSSVFKGYERIYCLPEGRIISFDGPNDEETGFPQYAVNLFAINAMDAYTMPESWNSKVAKKVHIMLSHDTYKGRLAGISSKGQHPETIGSARLHDLIVKLSPLYHFFGHHHRYCPEVQLPNNENRITKSIGLNQVFLPRHHEVISQDCFGILRLSSPNQMAFEIVEDKWFKSLRYSDCRTYL